MPRSHFRFLCFISGEKTMSCVSKLQHLPHLEDGQAELFSR